MGILDENGTELSSGHGILVVVDGDTLGSCKLGHSKDIYDIYVQYNWAFINHKTTFLMIVLIQIILCCIWGSVHILFLCHSPECIVLNSSVDVICFLNFRLKFCNAKLFNLFLILLVFRP